MHSEEGEARVGDRVDQPSYAVAIGRAQCPVLPKERNDAHSGLEAIARSESIRLQACTGDHLFREDGGVDPLDLDPGQSVH